jgi:hypothetical protein
MGSVIYHHPALTRGHTECLEDQNADSLDVWLWMCDVMRRRVIGIKGLGRV